MGRICTREFSDGGRNPRFAPVRSNVKGDGGQKGRICTRRLTSPFYIDSQAVTADVASPRPREVGGACRIQVLAAARTQETVGGPNGATRSEFRRGCLTVGIQLVGQVIFLLLQQTSIIRLFTKNTTFVYYRITKQLINEKV